MRSLLPLSALASLAAALQPRDDLPAGCNCTAADIGCQYGIVSVLPQGTLQLLAPNGTNTGETANPGYTLAGTFTPAPCHPDANWLIGILDGNGSDLDKVYNSPDLLGPILINIGGNPNGSNASFQLSGEPLQHGGLYQATIFTYNASDGSIGSAVTDLDFTWEVPYPY